MSTPESQVLKAICQYLDMCERQGKLTYWRQNNNSVYDWRNGLYRAFNGPGSKLGVPDIIVCKAPVGSMVCFEAKSATEVQSKGQKQMQAAIVASGGHYFVVRSVDDVVAALGGC